jgi:Barrel-sandwich domain of CusB or HlyD membrane-fusion
MVRVQVESAYQQAGNLSRAVGPGRADVRYLFSSHPVHRRLQGHPGEGVPAREGFPEDEVETPEVMRRGWRGARERQTNEHQQAAADANRAKAGVRLAYTEIHAPIAGIVDVRAARPGEVVSPGQPIVTLVNPDDLWVRADVEETYIDRVRIGDHLTVRLPSGEERQGTVFYRGVDAGFAT